MSRFFADLHIHSRFSRATSPSLTVANIAFWARKKGISLVGTGDMTHPGWLAQLTENLVLTDSGFYRYSLEPDKGPYFVPTGEVSAIYKQAGRTRKIHLVIIAPDLLAAKQFSEALARVGNVTSDGRPILGMSARNILEIALSVDERMQVVPAHIWTPWFSLFGSKSGFDSIQECFADLSGHIRALETGLSSDPAMNRLLSALDNYALISSSDAHGPEKLGREATVIEGPPTWQNLVEALQGGPRLIGTVEFFPEEGKYHLDGHADCGPALTPAETAACGGICPVCGKPVTVGVLSRVLELSDRSEVPEGILKPDWHILPLVEVLSQVLNKGPATKEVGQHYEKLVNAFESEYNLLLTAPLADIKTHAGPLLTRAIEKMRLGEVEAQGGYDGVFGKIIVIGRQERLTYSGEGLLFTEPQRRRASRTASVTKPQQKTPSAPQVIRRPAAQGSILSDLTLEQLAAVSYGGQSLAVSAGPGSGKTLVLIRRAAWLIRKGVVKPNALLLTTYTKKAAETLSERLYEIIPDLAQQVRVGTLHSVALEIASQAEPDYKVASKEIALALATAAAAHCALSPKKFQSAVSFYKNNLAVPADNPGLERAMKFYQSGLKEQKLWDYEDLISLAIQHSNLLNFEAVLADEFQDFSLAQFKFLTALSRNRLITVIGDPDQSIYGFRGAMEQAFDELNKERPDLTRLDLALNFRSSPIICQASEALRPTNGAQRLAFNKEPSDKIGRAVLDSPQAESYWVVSRVLAHLGVTNLGAKGSTRSDREVLANLGLNDVAIIFRLRQQGLFFTKALDDAGLAWQMAGEEELTATDSLDFKADKINLLTMHASKGLEFKLVFVVGLEDGLCPYTLDGSMAHAEEKRLFYVAVTRAKNLLYLTRTSSRIVYGKHLTGVPSPYLNNLPNNLCLDYQPRSVSPPPPKISRLF